MASQNNNKEKQYFEKMYEQTNRNVTLFLISKCKNFADVNDILQEVYMEYFKTISKKGISYILDEERFLISLCRKKISTYYSFWDRIPHKLSLDEQDDYENDSVLYEQCEGNAQEEELFQKEMIEDVKKLLSMQPVEIQKIFYLYYTMECKIPEIANLLGMKVQTVKNKLFRTRKMLKEKLQDWR